jgi:hypothetical protein
MAPPRKSLAHAAMSGALYKNPQRYRVRIEPLVSDPLGAPPAWMRPEPASAWEDFRQRLPWLNRSHRGITEIASLLQARFAAGELGVPGLNLLRLCLGSMGGTPATSRFGEVPKPAAKDLADEFFG